MGATFSIDSAGPYNVTASNACKRIVIQEDYNSANPPTCDLRKYQPAGSLSPIRIAKGTPAIFTRLQGYQQGDVAGQINTASGSCTVQQDEGDTV